MSRYKKYKETYQRYYHNHKEYFRKYGRQYRKEHLEKFRVGTKKWKKNNPEKVRVHHLIGNHPKRYPLNNNCFFCETTKNLEHTHLDYEDEGHNYITACGQCNRWMG